jgi:hypothetical protein
MTRGNAIHSGAADSGLAPRGNALPEARRSRVRERGPAAVDPKQFKKRILVPEHIIRPTADRARVPEILAQVRHRGAVPVCRNR